MGIEKSVGMLVAFFLILSGLILGAIVIRNVQEKEPGWKSARLKYADDTKELSVIYKGQVMEQQIVPQGIDGSKITVSIQRASGDFEEMSFEGTFKTMEMKTITLPEDTVTAYVYYEDVEGDKVLIGRVGELIN